MHGRSSHCLWRGSAALVLVAALGFVAASAAQEPRADGRAATASSAPGARPAPATSPAPAAPAVSAAPASPAASAVSSAWTLERRYEVSWSSNPSPVPLLVFHEWTLALRDAGGREVDGATVEVRGGMPEHDHGLPSVPVVTPLGGGRYRIEGLRFHMPGAWVLLFTFARDGVRDTLRVELSL